MKETLITLPVLIAASFCFYFAVKMASNFVDWVSERIKNKAKA